MYERSWSARRYIMKQLLLGNEAVARGLYEAGVRVVSSYPGTPSTEITEAAAKFEEIYCEWAPNEKVAAEVAAGASIAGARSFCAMKHVGLNVAADLLYTISYTGVNGGMVIAVADDPGMHSSQNEQDSRHHAIASKVPMLEPSDSAECCSFTKLAYSLSEEYDTPVIIRLSTRISHSCSIVDTQDRKEIDLKPYEKQPSKYVVLPAFARAKHPLVEERTKKLSQWAENCDINRIENNHIDVFVFEFASVLQWLSKEYKEPRFAHFAEVISTSMRQLLPHEGHLCGIAKSGFYPEVVQHTNWDYGKNGKGYYNDIFAPGWTVASLWELLTPGRAEHFLK